MFRFSYHMMAADIKRALRGWTIVVMPLLLFGAAVLPWEDMSPGGYMYAIIMTFTLLRPQFSKIYQVVPLTISQIKKIIFWRVAMLDFYVVLIYLAFYFCTSWWNIKADQSAIHFYLLYICLISFVASTSVGSFKEKKRAHVWNRDWFICTIDIIFLLILMLQKFGLHDGELRNISYIISGCCAVLSNLLLAAYISDIHFKDYVYIPIQQWRCNKKGVKEKP